MLLSLMCDVDGCGLVFGQYPQQDPIFRRFIAMIVVAVHLILDARMLDVHHVIRGNQNTR